MTTEDRNDPFLRYVLTRRQMMLGAFSAATAVALAACGSKSENASVTTAAAGVATTSSPTTAAAAGATTTVATAAAAGAKTAAKFGGGGKDGTIKIGFTAPLTGPLADFGQASVYVLEGIRALLKDGLMVGGKSYKVDILHRDVESNADTAAARAGELITKDKVDLMLAIAAPEMINPVADQCEANKMPCLSTLGPWQAYYFPRGGTAEKGFDWTYHIFWGAEQLVGNYVELWNAVPTNKKVGILCPNDPDGNALADPKTGFPAGATAAGYTVVDPGRFETLSPSFDSIIGKFKAEGVEIICGIPIPPDFATFWTAAQQQGFKPKVVTMAKAVLFPQAVEALGNAANGICSEIWWHPNHPYSSSLTGASAAQLCAQYETATGKQWTQFVGFIHALFEVAFDVLGRAGSADKKAVIEATAATNLTTIIGPIQYGAKGVPKNIAPTALVGGQWQTSKDGKHKFDLVVVNNKLSPEIPVNGTLKALG